MFISVHLHTQWIHIFLEKVSFSKIFQPPMKWLGRIKTSLEGSFFTHTQKKNTVAWGCSRSEPNWEGEGRGWEIILRNPPPPPWVPPTHHGQAEVRRAGRMSGHAILKLQAMMDGPNLALMKYHLFRKESLNFFEDYLKGKYKI